jgi:hypothetical protein
MGSARRELDDCPVWLHNDGAQGMPMGNGVAWKVTSLILKEFKRCGME